MEIIIAEYNYWIYILLMMIGLYAMRYWDYIGRLRTLR